MGGHSVFIIIIVIIFFCIVIGNSKSKKAKAGTQTETGNSSLTPPMVRGKNQDQTLLLYFLHDTPRTRITLAKYTNKEAKRERYSPDMNGSQPGCFKEFIYEYYSEEEFHAAVKRILTSMKIRERALEKVGLDEDECTELQPVNFAGYNYQNATIAKELRNGSVVCDTYQSTWIFFTSTQVLLYSVTLNLTDRIINEKTEEYFYKDVTSFGTQMDTETVKTGTNSISVPDVKFTMVVPGATFSAEVKDFNGDFEQTIKGMKFKLREKKEQ